MKKGWQIIIAVVSIMVLLGGVETLTGPVVGAAIFTWLRDAVARNTEFWRAVMGGVILLIALLLLSRFYRKETEKV